MNDFEKFLMANEDGKDLSNAYLTGGIQGGDTVVLTVYEQDSMGLWQPVASASFEKPRPPLIVRWVQALQRAARELLG